MVGQNYNEIIKKLVEHGRWRCGASEEGYTELFTWNKDTTEVIDIWYADGVITIVNKYSY